MSDFISLCVFHGTHHHHDDGTHHMKEDGYLHSAYVVPLLVAFFVLTVNEKGVIGTMKLNGKCTC